MTYAKLLGFGFGLALVLAVTKSVFYTSFAWGDSVSLHLVYWIMVVVLATALVRRLGIITFLEAILVIVLWLVFQILLDILVVLPATGWQALVDPSFALGYVLVALAIFIFHKKLHIQRRRDLKAKT